MSGDQEEKLSLLHSQLKPIKKPPRLYLINASGRSWIGFHSDPVLRPMLFGLYGAIILGFPILPLKFFLISNPRDDGGIMFSRTLYNVHGPLSLVSFSRVYGTASLLKLFLCAYLRFILAIVALLAAIAIFSYSVPLIGKALKYIGG